MCMTVKCLPYILRKTAAFMMIKHVYIYEIHIYIYIANYICAKMYIFLCGCAEYHVRGKVEKNKLYLFERRALERWREREASQQCSERRGGFRPMETKKGLSLQC